MAYTTEPLEIGPSRNVLGTVAGVRVWNHARTAGDVQADLFRDVPINSPGLMLDLRFNEGPDAITIEDSSPSDNSGSIITNNQRYDDPERVPFLATAGDYPVTLRVDDGKGGVTEQRFSVRVTSPFATTVSGTIFDDANGDRVRQRRAIDNLLVNGDFTSGAVGFTSELTAGTYTGTDYNSQRPGVFTVGNALAALPGSNFYLEHTSRTGSALLVTALRTDRVAWAQTVAVTAGQSYDFGFWAHRTGTEPARFRVRVNGQQLGGAFDTATIENKWWSRFAATWTAGAATEARIEIIMLGAVGTGTVGSVLDDLTFQPANAPMAVVFGANELWLAGLAAGSKANGDTAPASSPRAVPGLNLVAGQVLTFTFAGGTSTTSTPFSASPDGYAANTVVPAVNGLSGLLAPTSGALIAVFLSDDSPAGQTPPTTLNFGAGGNVPGGIDYLSLAPELRQVFFVGDGLTAGGVAQQITVPVGATRLYFGTLDNGTNADNPDGFNVSVFNSAVPELEPALANRMVYVDTDGDGRRSPGELTALTNAAGVYSIRLTGTVARIGLVPEAGRVQTAPTVPTRLVDLSMSPNRIDFASRAVADGQPVFVSVPPSLVSAPGVITYAAFASSTNGSPVTYKLAVGPVGAVIDAASGRLSWAAGTGDAGPVELILTATDGAGRVAFQQFTLTVTVNTPPVITSVSPTAAMVGVPMRYDVAAQDAEQTALTFALEAAPVGMSIDPVTGRLRWTPQVLGTQTATVVVRDGVGGEVRQTITVVVNAATANTAPAFAAGPRSTAQVGTPYRSQVTATDPDGDVLDFALLDGPAGLTVAADGAIAWTPADLGPVAVRVRVSDGRGGVAERLFTIAVGTTPVRSTVIITSSPPANAVLDRPYAYDLVAPGAVTFELLVGPDGLSLDPVRGRVRWTPTDGQLGPVTVTIRASDELGAATEQTWTLTTRGSALAPAFASTPPTTAAVGATYVYPARANNPGGSPLAFALVAGPAGMRVDAATGDVTWIPAADQTGPQAVVLRVGDGAGSFSTQAYEIVVTAGVANRPPVAGSVPPTDATIGQLLAFTFAATDPDGGAVTFSVVRGPAGLVIDPVTGGVSWTPTAADLGTVAITLVARDPQGAAAVQSFLVDVRAPNQAPTITNTPPATVPQGGVYRYDIQAIDPDREPLFYAVMSGPVGMTVDALGRVRWQTELTTPLGSNEATVRVSDGRGSSASRTFTVNVVADTIAPRIAIVVVPSLLYPYSLPARVRVTLTDDVGVVGVRVLLDGRPVALAADNSFSVPYTAPGNGRIQVFAVDAAGNEGRAVNRVIMRTGLENDPNNLPGEPTATLAVAEGTTVGGFFRILGTATSPDLERYTLSYRRADQSTFIVLGSGTTSVNAGELGVWDTTLLENDGYVLRLEVTDLFGGSATVERTVGVSGVLKLGNFRLSFADVTVPVAGLPITVARTYDTLRADRADDFGFGWRLEYRDTDLRTSLPRSGLEGIGVYTAFRAGVRVYLTLPGGQREGFTFTPDVRVLPGFGGQNLTVATPRFTPDRGVTNKLSAGSGNLLVSEFGDLSASGGVPWNPASPDFSGYSLTTKEGVVYSINGGGQLTTARDRNGNTLTFTEAGVTGPGGAAVTFERDARGRITAAIDPLGHAVRYAYSATGDLTTVTDRESNTTRFGYRADRPHYLASVTDPLGRVGVRSEYDANGRLTGTVDAGGGRVAVSYDPAKSLVTIADPSGSPTTTEYDDRGNVVAVTDGLGNTTRLGYDPAGNMTRQSDALGASLTYTYDGTGRELSRTDRTGHTTRYTYGTAGQVTSVTDPLGNSSTFVVDGKGNRLTGTDPLGHVTRYAYDGRGLLAAVTDAAGAVTAHEYDARGQRVRTVDALGHATATAFDAAGNRLRLTATRTTPAGERTVTVSATFDRNGRPLTGTDAAGNVSRWSTTRTAGSVPPWTRSAGEPSTSTTPPAG